MIQFGHGMTETGVTACTEAHGRIHRADTRQTDINRTDTRHGRSCMHTRLRPTLDHAPRHSAMQGTRHDDVDEDAPRLHVAAGEAVRAHRAHRADRTFAWTRPPRIHALHGIELHAPSEVAVLGVATLAVTLTISVKAPLLACTDAGNHAVFTGTPDAARIHRPARAGTTAAPRSAPATTATRVAAACSFRRSDHEHQWTHRVVGRHRGTGAAEIRASRKGIGSHQGIGSCGASPRQLRGHRRRRR